jgi:pantetheine-phosphate adenylyltransferase
MSERVAIYAGSFDPPTNGHLWMIERGAEIFDRLIVAIGVNPAKKSMFTVCERMAMLQASTEHLKNITVASFTNRYLIHYAKSLGALFILRGIRNATDQEFERMLQNVNRDIAPEITTVFMMGPREYLDISSSLVKGLVGPDGWEELVAKYVPPAVLVKLKEAQHA